MNQQEATDKVILEELAAARTLIEAGGGKVMVFAVTHHNGMGRISREFSENVSREDALVFAQALEREALRIRGRARL